MNYTQQDNLIKNTIPDIYVLKNNLLNEIYIDAYSETVNYAVSPISELLLKLYNYYNKITSSFCINQYKWSYATIQTLMLNYDTFEKILNNQYGDDYEHRIIVIYVSRGYSIFDLAKAHPGYIHNASLALQTDQTHKIAVVKHNEKLTVILTSKIDESEMQAYYSLVPIVFNKDKLPEKLIESFLMLANFEYDEICENIKELIKEFDLKKIKLERVANTFKVIFNNNTRVQAVNRDIQNTENEIKHLFDNIATYTQKLKGYQQAQLIALAIDPSEQIEELMSFLNSNKFIKDVATMSAQLINLKIQTPIYFIEEELLKKYLKTPRSYLYEHPAIMRTFLKEVFLDKKYTLIVQASIDMYLNKLNGNLIGTNAYRIEDILRTQTYGTSNMPKDAIPQPHLSYYNCYGGNKTHMTLAIKNNDIIGFIAQLIASCQNLNFGDTTVMSRFFKDLLTYGTNSKCIIDNETNKAISFKEYRALKEPQAVPVEDEENVEDENE